MNCSHMPFSNNRIFHEIDIKMWENIVSHSLLFSRIVELVFIRSAETLLDAGIDPQSLHGGEQLLGERFRVLHTRDDVHHHLGVGLFV